jgi:hypothetical protein
VINVKVRDKKWWLNDAAVAPRIQTSFKWFGYVYPGPHQDLGKARAWLERLQEYGFHGGRFFLEANGWALGGHPFWSAAPHVAPWNLSQPTNSNFKLSTAQKRSLEWAAQVLMDMDLIGEFVINATIKESPGPLHNRTKQTVQYWERMQRTTMQFLRDIGATNIWYENTNEYGAHVDGDVFDAIISPPPGKTRTLLEFMAYRARGVDHPGVPCGISHGGRWDIQYPVKLGDLWAFSHVNIHSTRHGENWHEVRGRINRLFMLHGTAVFLNENMFHMTPEQWHYWVTEGNWGQSQKLANQSTTHTAKIIHQMQETLDMGAGYCLHNMNGAASDPDAAPDEAELWVRQEYGDGPGPDPVLRFDHIIQQAFREILLRDVDPEGLASYNHAMREGMLTEWQLRQVLMLSPEYKERFTR